METVTVSLSCPCCTMDDVDVTLVRGSPPYVDYINEICGCYDFLGGIIGGQELYLDQLLEAAESYL